MKDQKKLKPVTLKEFRNEYEAYAKGTKSKGYFENINLSFKIFIQFTGDCKLNKIDSRIIEKIIISIDSKYSSSGQYRTLKASFNVAKIWNYIKENPFLDVKPPKLPKKIPLFISESELQMILNEIDNTNVRDMILLSNDTGLRLGEVVNLRWKTLIFKKTYSSKQF